MTIQKMNSENIQVQPKKQLRFKSDYNNNNNNNNNNDRLKINVYNYFLDDFPKSYYLSWHDTLQTLKHKIVEDTKIRMSDIKNFKDERGRDLNSNEIISHRYTNDSNLNLVIYFNQDLKITTNNKKIMYFMYDNTFINNNNNNNYLMEQQNQRNKLEEINNAITNFYQSEKGGKIIIGVQPEDGLIKGVNIPEQDEFKNNFIYNFHQQFLNNASSILKNVEISFFRVKGQNKNIYNYHDHKKIMIIKIKGKNQQKDASNCSTDDDEENHTEELKQQQQNNLTLQSFNHFNNNNNNIQSPEKNNNNNDFFSFEDISPAKLRTQNSSPQLQQQQQFNIPSMATYESIKQLYFDNSQQLLQCKNQQQVYSIQNNNDHEYMNNQSYKLFSTPQNNDFLDFLLDRF